MAKYLRDVNSEKILVAKTATKPKMSDNGSVWKSVPLRIDGNSVQLYYESLRGSRAYLQLNGTWYWVKLKRAAYESSSKQLGDSYQSNFEILTSPERTLKTVPKYEFTTFLEQVGFDDYSPYA